MQLLRNLLNKVEPLFHKGGKLEKAFPLYEAGDTFLFTPGEKTKSGPHVRDGIDLKRTMSMVVLALIPATLFGMWNVGYQHQRATTNWGLSPGSADHLAAFIFGAWKFLPLYIVTIIAGGTLEAIFSIIRKHEINEGFLVTSLLIPLTLPPDIPLWQVAIATIFGVVIGKEVFGGTGMNILNPALTARIFLYFAYPADISGDKVWVSGSYPGAATPWIDGATGATPLGYFAAEGNNLPGMADTLHITWFDAFMGWIPGSIGETSTLACLIGAAILIFSGIGSWRIMLGCLLGMAGLTLLMNALAPEAVNGVPHFLALGPEWHLVIGGFAFGMVFMATDPVSAAQTNVGRWIYGFLIGGLTVIVRVLNPAYPEGIMLAIVFMNFFAPLIDYYVTKANIRRREVRLGLQ